MLNKTLVDLVAVGTRAGCAQPDQSARGDLLDRPIDCKVADIDLAALEAAIPGAGERAAEGVRLVVPVARISGQVRGKRGEEELRARMAEIKVACPDANAAYAVVAG